MAEGVGFEPTVELPLHGISSAAPSATRPPLLHHCDLLACTTAHPVACTTPTYSTSTSAPDPPACTSADRPNRLAQGQHGFAMLRINWRRGEDLNPRGTCAPIRFRVGRLQPGSATPPQAISVSFPTQRAPSWLRSPSLVQVLPKPYP